MKKVTRMVTAVLTVVLVLLGIYAGHFLYYPEPEERDEGETHDHHNDLEEWWHPIGASPNYQDEEHSFQSMVIGDLLGDGTQTAVSHYHHGQVGMFLNTKQNGTWQKEFLHPKFVRGTEDSGGWPVKGLVGEDIDDDGYKEVLTAADVVSFPLEGEKGRPFPGVIYIDLNEGGTEINPQPLVWGIWGERMAGQNFSSLMPRPIPQRFRGRDSDRSDIMVMTSTEHNGMAGCSRLFVLEQPADGFNDYNYTYEMPTTIGDFPYENEPFYVNHLYVNNSGILSEMVFTPNRWHPQMMVDSSTLNGFGILDFNGDDMMDLAVSLEYWHGGGVIGSEVYLYKRVASSYPHIHYLFEEVDKMHIEKTTYGGLTTANLDGDVGNGDETLVFGSKGIVGSSNASVANYITIENGEMVLHTLDIDPDSEEYPYIGCYANTLVVDGNRDGYDDIIVLARDKDSTFGSVWSDIVYFQNTGQESGEGRFLYDKDHMKILMKGQSPSWSLTMQQCDEDEELELVICLLNKLPYWEETEDSEAHVYYCNLHEVVKK